MRLRQLTDAKFRKSTTMYHGTTSDFLPSILKKGLVPDPKKKYWADDPNASLTKASLASLHGSYWTSNIFTATSSATNTTNKFGGDKIIVIAQIQTQSAFADEDNLAFPLEWNYNKAFGGNISEKPRQVAYYFYDDKNYYENAKKNFIKLVHDELSKNNEKKPVASQLLSDAFDAMSLRIIAHGIRDAGADKYWNPLKDIKNKPDTEPTVAETEKNLLDTKDKLSQRYRETTLDKDDFRHTLRITEPVTYSGANRITHVVEIPDGYVENGNFVKPPIILHYGNKKNIPEKFIQDFKSRVGKWPGVVEKGKS